MQLSGSRIEADSLVKGADSARFRASSYDLRIGSFVDPQGEVLAEDFTLEPHGLVTVVSAERVTMPPNVSGYAMVKTDLCSRGVLAIGIGIIDPGYSGPISSVLINFGKGPHNLRRGDVFLRATFHELCEMTDPPTVPSLSDADYLEGLRKKVKSKLSGDFLDLPNTVKRLATPVAQEVIGDWRAVMFKYVPIVASFVAFMAMMVAVGSSYAGRWTTQDTAIGQAVERGRADSALETRLGSLAERLEAAERRLSLPTSATKLDESLVTLEKRIADMESQLSTAGKQLQLQRGSRK